MTRTSAPVAAVCGAILLGIVSGACASGSATPSVAAASDAGVTLDARLLQSLDMRRGDTNVVDAMLRDASAARRARGALAVGQLGMRTRYATLRALLVDTDTAVAANAAYALGMAHDTGSVSALARAVAGAPDVVAREAAWALGEIGEPARLTITVALGDGVARPLTASTAAQRSPTVRAALLTATVKLRPIPVSTVLPWLADTASESVRAAAYVIGRPRLPSGARALLAVRSHRDEETRQHVARGLARQATGDSLAGPAREALVALLGDASARVRANAARSIASFGPSALRDVERALTDGDANVRVAAAEGVQAVFARDTGAWGRAWRRDTTFRVRQQLLSAARAAGVTTLSAAESEWSRDPDWRRRAAALDSRGADSTADRMAVAREFLRDTDARIRAMALRVIPQAANDSIVRAMVTPHLADPDLQVRAASMSALVRRARANDIDVALAGWESARTDADGDARTAALRLIAAAWARDSLRATSAQRESLAKFTGDGAASDRRLVSAVTPMAGWARAEPPVVNRPTGDYERLARQWLVPGARMPRAVIRTERGDITLELLAADAPLVVEAFMRLASTGYYRNTYFHRVVPNFVVQDGDARGDGSGGPGFTLRESWTRRRHDRGSLGLATSGPDTGGSQYYLCHSPQPHLDGAYTVFGRVTGGFEVMDRIVQGDRMIRIDIE